MADDRQNSERSSDFGRIIDRWTQEIRACCSLIAHTTSRNVSRIAIVIPKINSDDLARELWRMAEYIAAEYGVAVAFHRDDGIAMLVFVRSSESNNYQRGKS